MSSPQTIPSLLALLLAVITALPPAALALHSEPKYARMDVERERYLARHLLRRAGFGANRYELHKALRMGRARYLEQQLRPETINDDVAEARMPPLPGRTDDSAIFAMRWYARMVYSRRQLLEKMTLLWHEHFATSVGKVGSYVLMKDQEQTLRAHALGRFGAFLVAMIRDAALMYFLDNSYNNGRAVADDGTPIPPNENFARELMQLFALGVHQLHPDGTPVLGADGRPLPAYTERDVREVARALTGWVVNYPSSTPEDPTEVVPPPVFYPELHDPGAKTVLGETIPAAEGEEGARDVERVVDILMRQPTMAPFISKILIQKLATETPSPGYVARVSSVFSATRGDIKAVVRAILTDGEFYSDEVIRTQYKEPIELLVGAVRALEGRTGGASLFAWSLPAGQQLYYPPSVFSFYRPGHKRSLVTHASVIVRDQAADTIANSYVDGYYDTTFDARRLIRRHRLGRPDKAVDYLATVLVGAPLREEVRREVIAYIGERVTEEKFRGAAWLILCSPDFQVN